MVPFTIHPQANEVFLNFSTFGAPTPVLTAMHAYYVSLWGLFLY